MTVDLREKLGRFEELCASKCCHINCDSECYRLPNLLRDLNHVESLTMQQIRAEHEKWWTDQCSTVKPRTSFPNSRDPNRPLRIGLMSPDFRDHSVAYFLEPWLANRDRAAIEVFLYAEVPAPWVRPNTSATNALPVV